MRLDTLRNVAGEKATFAYNAEGLVTSHTLLGLNNLNVSHDYVWTHSGMMDTLSDATLTAALGWGLYFDSAGRVIGANHGPWATPDRSRQFVFDSSGQLVAYGDSAWTYTAAPEPCTRSLAGDPCPNRTQNITLSGIRSGKYVYDSVGNRKDTLVAGGGLDSGNRLRRWGNYRMDYDAAGSLVAKRTLKASDTTQVVRRDSLFWSALGLLDSVRTRDSLNTLTRVGFGYDASGRRIRKSTASGTSRYLWDGSALVMELDSLGNRKAEYTYYPGADNPESVRRHDWGDTTYYYHQDGAGNVVALLKKTGTTNAIAAQYDSFDPFGNGQTSGGSVPNPLQFAGREYDAETGLNYLRARYYDPAVGRFVSEDPAGAGINQYAYAGNDPGDGRDPSGLAGCKSECGDPDGMVHRLWLMSKERGPCDFCWMTLGMALSVDNLFDVGGGSSAYARAYAAVNAWFVAKFGIGLAAALNGTSGDCTFSGGGSIACSAGSAFSRVTHVSLQLTSGFRRCPNPAVSVDGRGRVTLDITTTYNERGYEVRSIRQEQFDARVAYFLNTKTPGLTQGYADYLGAATIYRQFTGAAAWGGNVLGEANCAEGGANLYTPLFP